MTYANHLSLMSTASLHIADNRSLTIDTTVVETVDVAPDLGELLDSELTMTQHKSY